MGDYFMENVPNWLKIAFGILTFLMLCLATISVYNVLEIIGTMGYPDNVTLVMATAVAYFSCRYLYHAADIIATYTATNYGTFTEFLRKTKEITNKETPDA